MANENQGVRQPIEFSFEKYVERQFILIHERLDFMGIDIAGLEVDEQVLAEVIPQLATEIGTLQTNLDSETAALAAKVTELEAKEAEVAADEAALAGVRAELATAQGELAAVERVKTGLDPVVAEAQKLAPAPLEAAAAGEAPAAAAGDAPADPNPPDAPPAEHAPTGGTS